MKSIAAFQLCNAIFSSLLIHSNVVVEGALQDFNDEDLEPQSDTLHFSSEFLVNPGFVDLSDLIFTSKEGQFYQIRNEDDSPLLGMEDDEEHFVETDDYSDANGRVKDPEDDYENDEDDEMMNDETGGVDSTSPNGPDDEKSTTTGDKMTSSDESEPENEDDETETKDGNDKTGGVDSTSDFDDENSTTTGDKMTSTDESESEDETTSEDKLDNEEEDENELTDLDGEQGSSLDEDGDAEMISSEDEGASPNEEEDTSLDKLMTPTEEDEVTSTDGDEATSFDEKGEASESIHNRDKSDYEDENSTTEKEDESSSTAAGEEMELFDRDEANPIDGEDKDNLASTDEEDKSSDEQEDQDEDSKESDEDDEDDEYISSDSGESDDDDTDENGEYDEDGPALSESGDGDRRQLDGVAVDFIDIIFFQEPFACSRLDNGSCDWTKLGIGTKNEVTETHHYCCTEMNADMQMCEKENVGRIILDSKGFKGQHRVLPVARNTGDVMKVDMPRMETVQGTGKYTLALANCNDDGGSVTVNGVVTWSSKDGLLPGELFGEYRVSIFLTVLYVGVLVWFAKRMYKFREEKIAIQNWILLTIILGLTELLFKTTDFIIWNMEGRRTIWVIYTWIMIGVLRRSFARCLIVAVSLGWGVIHDKLDEMKKIIIAGLIYAGLAFTVDVTDIVFEKEYAVLSVEEQNEFIGILDILVFGISAMDVFFYLWILDSLNNTMEHLESMNQLMKLKRYLRLRLILLISILFVIVFEVFIIVNSKMEDGSIVGEGQSWAFSTVSDANYIFVLLSVAILWQPNSNARQYAYVMELPTVANDLDLDTNVDTIDDFEDNVEDDGVKVSYRDGQDDQDNRFQID